MSQPTAATRPQPPGAPAKGPDWWPLVAVCTAVFMLLIDVTVVNVALPDIQHELHASFQSLQWVVDAYALTLAAFQLTSGSLGDRLGRKPVFVSGIAVFAAFSLACGLAPNATSLDAFRGLQGLGGAIMFANSLAIIGETYSGRARGTAFGIWGATTGASIAIGPLIGGALTSGVGWRWIFFVNLPIAVLAIAVSLRSLSASRRHNDRAIDWVGLVLFSVLLVVFVYALIQGNDAGWTSPQILAYFGASAAGLAGFVWWELRQRFPMFDVRLFRRPAFSGAQAAALAVSASLFAMFLYLTLYLQDELGFSAFATGVRLLPITVMTFLAAPLAGRLSSRLPYRLLIGTGLGLVAAGLALMSGLTAHSSWTALLIGFVIAGFGSGMVNPPLGSLATAVVDRAQSGMGAGINNTFRQVGLSVGIAFFGALFQARVGASLAGQLPHASAGQLSQLSGAVSAGAVSQTLPHIPAAVRHQVAHAALTAFVSGLDEILIAAAVLAALGALATLLLVRQQDLVSGGHEGASAGG